MSSTHKLFPPWAQQIWWEDLKCDTGTENLLRKLRKLFEAKYLLHFNKKHGAKFHSTTADQS